MTDINAAIEQEKWDDVQYLLLAREGRTAEALSRLYKERASLLEDWRSRLRGFPERDYRQSLREMERMTFGMVNRAFKFYLVSLRKFLNFFKDILAKLAAAFLLAVPAAIAHQIVAERIGRAFDGWLWQCLALVGFILIYRTLEKPLEGAFEKRVAAIRQWGLRAEARGAYLGTVKVQQKEAEMSRLRAWVTSELRKSQGAGPA